MSQLKHSRLTGIIGVVAAVAIVMAIGGSLTAETQPGLRAVAGGPVAEQLTQQLPPVARGPMTVTPDAGRATSILSFDDGTCEAGLGAGTVVTDLVDFDVPTQCIQSGLDIVGVTARVNTGTATAFAFAQAGATPPAVTAVSTVPLGSAIAAIGPCPGSATALTTRAVGPGAAVITGTANFFAGIKGSAYVGRDTSVSAGRIWLLCATCSMTQYSPAALSGFGLGGNWMIRVTVEDANCVPVELMELSVS